MNLKNHITVLKAERGKVIVKGYDAQGRVFSPNFNQYFLMKPVCIPTEEDMVNCLNSLGHNHALILNPPVEHMAHIRGLVPTFAFAQMSDEQRRECMTRTGPNFGVAPGGWEQLDIDPAHGAEPTAEPYAPRIAQIIGLPRYVHKASNSSQHLLPDGTPCPHYGGWRGERIYLKFAPGENPADIMNRIQDLLWEHDLYVIQPKTDPEGNHTGIEARGIIDTTTTDVCKLDYAGEPLLPDGYRVAPEGKPSVQDPGGVGPDWPGLRLADMPTVDEAALRAKQNRLIKDKATEWGVKAPSPAARASLGTGVGVSTPLEGWPVNALVEPSTGGSYTIEEFRELAHEYDGIRVRSPVDKDGDFKAIVHAKYLPYVISDFAHGGARYLIKEEPVTESKPGFDDNVEVIGAEPEGEESLDSILAKAPAPTAATKEKAKARPATPKRRWRIYRDDEGCFYGLETRTDAGWLNEGPVTPWVLNVLSVKNSGGSNNLECKFTRKGRRPMVVDLPAATFADLRSFNTAVNNAFLILGPETRRGLLYEIMTQEVHKCKVETEERHGVGLHRNADGDWMFLSPTLNIGPECEKYHLAPLRTAAYWEGCFPEPKVTVSPARANELLRTIMRLSTTENMALALAWHAAALVRPKLVEVRSIFPIFNFAGGTGAGKTTMWDRVFGPLFGGKPYITAGSDLAFSSTLAGIRPALCESTSVPIKIDEYKRSSVGRQKENQLSGLLRSLYDGQTYTQSKRGGEGEVTTFNLSTPLAALGESKVLDDATTARMIGVELTVAMKTQETRAALEALSAAEEELLALNRQIIEMSLSLDAAVFYKNIMSAANALKGAEFSEEKQRMNTEVLLVGAWVLHRITDGLFSIDTDLIVGGMKEVEERAGGEDNVVKFLTTAAALSGTKLFNTHHYLICEDYVAIDLKSCYGIVTAELMRTGEATYTDSPDAFGKLARVKQIDGKPIESRQLRGFAGGKRVRALCIPTPADGEFLDLFSTLKEPGDTDAIDPLAGVGADKDGFRDTNFKIVKGGKAPGEGAPILDDLLD